MFCMKYLVKVISVMKANRMENICTRHLDDLQVYFGFHKIIHFILTQIFQYIPPINKLKLLLVLEGKHKRKVFKTCKDSKSLKSFCKTL